MLNVTPERNPLPGAAIAVQTFGDFLGFNPHCHILIMDGCFYGKGMFRVAPPLELKELDAIFWHKVLRMLIAKGEITREMSIYSRDGATPVSMKVDPLVCPKCRGIMRIIRFIDDEQVIKAILDHLGLRPIRSRPPTKAHDPPLHRYAAGDAGQPIPDNVAYGDPDYPWDAYWKGTIRTGRNQI